MKTKVAKASLCKVPAPPSDDESQHEEVEVATYLGGDPLTCHFTMTNASLDEDN